MSRRGHRFWGLNLIASMPVKFLCVHGFCADIPNPWGFPEHECIGGGTLPDTTKKLEDVTYHFNHYYPSGAPGGGAGEVWEKCIQESIQTSELQPSLGRMLACLQRNAGGHSDRMVKKLLQGVTCQLFSGDYGSISEELCAYTDCGEPQLPDNDGEISL